MPFIIALDYDDTIFEGSYPDLGEPKWDVINKAKEFKKHGAQIALWTCREGIGLEEARIRLKEIELEVDGVNENVPAQIEYMKRTWNADKGEIFGVRKIYADIYVDDKAPGSIEYFLKIDVAKTCRNFEKRDSE